MESAGPIRAEFALTPADLREAAATNACPGLPPPRDRETVGWVAFLGLGVLVIQLVRFSKDRSDRPRYGGALDTPGMDWLVLTASTLPWVLGLIAIWAVVALRARSRLRRICDRDPKLGGTRTMAFDEAVWLAEGSAEPQRLDWSTFDRWIETPNLFLLRQQPGDVFHLVPKRAVPADRMTDLRDLIGAQVGRASHGFPVVPLPIAGPSDRDPRHAPEDVLHEQA